MTHAVDSGDYAVSCALLEYAADNKWLRRKEILVKRVEDKFSDEDEESQKSQYECRLRQRVIYSPHYTFDARRSTIYAPSVASAVAKSVIATSSIACMETTATAITATTATKSASAVKGSGAGLPEEVEAGKTRAKTTVHFHIFEEDRLQGKPFESAFYTREAVANPLIQACLNDDYELIRLLLEFGFVVWDPQRIDGGDVKKNPIQPYASFRRRSSLRSDNKNKNNNKNTNEQNIKSKNNNENNNNTNSNYNRNIHQRRQ